MDNEEPNKPLPLHIGPHKVRDRRRFIAERLTGKPEGVSIIALAKLCGVSDTTIQIDLDSLECQEAVQVNIMKRATSEGAAAAWRNVYNAIMSGDVKVSQWLLERVNIFAIAPREDWDELLHELFKGNGHQEVEPGNLGDPPAASQN